VGLLELERQLNSKDHAMTAQHADATPPAGLPYTTCRMPLLPTSHTQSLRLMLQYSCARKES